MAIRGVLGLLLAFAWALPSFGQVVPATPDPKDEPLFIVEEGAPPGFENLDLPQQTFVDVSYGGHDLSPAAATYTESSIRFENPEAIVREIGGVLYPARVVEALTGSLPSNVDRACLEPGVPEGCGVLTPEDASVIFDASRFHVEIFVGRRLLRLAQINDDERLPPPSDEWSGLATLGGSVSGTSNSEPSYDLRAATLVARGPTHFDFVSDLQTDGRYFVDRLAVHHDEADWQLTGGLYRATPFRVLGEAEVVGFRARSSLKTRTRLYLDRAYGSRLSIFLTRRSLVQVFRNGRLLANGVYDVGNQQLDTSELPSGAYEVEIRIKDPISGERTERQFFAKTDDLPPLGEIQFMGEAGFLRERSDTHDPLQVSTAGLLRFATSMRVTKQIGFDVDLALVDEENVFTAGALWLGPNTVVRAGPIVTSRGAAGGEFFGAFESGAFFANASLRGSWGHTGSRFLRIPSTDFLYSAAYTWRNVRFALRGDVRQRATDGNSRYSATPSVEVPLFRRTKLRGDLRLEYTYGDQGQLFFVKVDLVEWLDDFQFSQSIRGRYEDTNGNPNGFAEADLRARWRSPAAFPADVQADLRVSRRRERTSVAATGDLRSNRGSINGFVEQSFHDEFGPDTFYGTQFSIGVIGDREGVAALGDNAGSSALLVEIGGDYAGGVFDLFVNDARVGRARVGQPQIFPLPPYAQYSVRISSLDGQSIDYDSKPRTVVLYPGSSARLLWQVQRIFVLISAIVWPDGTPVAMGRITGAVGEAATDESGFLQADVTSGSHLRIETRDREDACLIRVPENPEKEDFIVLDELVCEDPSSTAIADQ